MCCSMGFLILMSLTFSSKGGSESVLVVIVSQARGEPWGSNNPPFFRRYYFYDSRLHSIVINFVYEFFETSELVHSLVGSRQ